MKWLKKMVETVRSNGVNGGLHVAWKEHGEAGEESYGKGDKVDLNFFFDTIERCHPFVFENEVAAGEWEQWEQSITTQLEDLTDDEARKLCPGLDSAPFPIFSIECLRTPLAAGPSSPTGHPLMCVLAREVGPLNFIFFSLFQSAECSEMYFVSACKVTARIAEIYVKSIGKQAIGLESIRESIRVGSGKEKRIHTIRKLIRVCPRASISRVRPLVSREIDWSHRWVTRGHWRKTNNLGKDRAGQYCVHGFTWVTEHEKGPKDAPLVSSKVRLVKGQGNKPQEGRP